MSLEGMLLGTEELVQSKCLQKQTKDKTLSDAGLFEILTRSVGAQAGPQLV